MNDKGEKWNRKKLLNQENHFTHLVEKKRKRTRKNRKNESNVALFVMNKCLRWHHTVACFFQLWIPIYNHHFIRLLTPMISINFIIYFYLHWLIEVFCRFHQIHYYYYPHWYFKLWMFYFFFWCVEMDSIVTFLFFITFDCVFFSLLFISLLPTLLIFLFWFIFLLQIWIENVGRNLLTISSEYDMTNAIR